jgi:hypothetical protein
MSNRYWKLPRPWLLHSFYKAAVAQVGLGRVRLRLPLPSDGRHEHMVHDWEVQEAHRQYKRRYGEAALEHLKRMYGETIPADNLHFIMGTMAAHPRTFIVIGLLRSGLDPAELAKQGTLF